MSVPKNFSIAGLATLTGIHRNTIEERLADVEPATVKQHKGKEMREYRSRDALPAIYAVPEVAGAKRRNRLEDLKIRDLEIDIEERLGNLWHRDATIRGHDAVASEAGAILNGVPHSIAHELIGKTDPIEIARIIESALNSARDKIAELRMLAPSAREDSGGEAAANGHTVG